MADDEFASSAERPLSAHMDVLRGQAPSPDGRVTDSVLRTLRWQRVVLLPLRAGAGIGTGLLHGVLGLLGSDTKGR